MNDPRPPREAPAVHDVREHVFWRSFHHAFEGIIYATRTQSNMRLHLVAAALVLPFEGVGDFVDIERLFGYKNDVGAARNAGVDCNPAGTAPHHFDNDHAIMRFGRRVYAVNGLGRDHHGGIETEADVGSAEVVIDGFWAAYDFVSALEQLHRNAHGIVAANCDQRVQLVGREVFQALLDSALALDGVCARGTKDGSAAG